MVVVVTFCLAHREEGQDKDVSANLGEKQTGEREKKTVDKFSFGPTRERG